jgi:hypothetical protein
MATHKVATIQFIIAEVSVFSSCWCHKLKICLFYNTVFLFRYKFYHVYH